MKNQKRNEKRPMHFKYNQKQCRKLDNLKKGHTLERENQVREETHILPEEQLDYNKSRFLSTLQI